MSTASPEYLKTLMRYYEEEIEGEAYFNAIADRLTDPDQRAKMRLLAEMETYAAAAVRPLIDKYALTPQAPETLHETARADAAKDSRDWPALVAEMRHTFPGYIDDFERLEAMAPPEDLSLLKILTDHEHAAIDFLEREARGDPASSAPMQRYMKTGTA